MAIQQVWAGSVEAASLENDNLGIWMSSTTPLAFIHILNLTYFLDQRRQQKSNSALPWVCHLDIEISHQRKKIQTRMKTAPCPAAVWLTSSVLPKLVEPVGLLFIDFSISRNGEKGGAMWILMGILQKGFWIFAGLSWVSAPLYRSFSMLPFYRFICTTVAFKKIGFVWIRMQESHGRLTIGFDIQIQHWIGRNSVDGDLSV